MTLQKPFMLPLLFLLLIYEANGATIVRTLPGFPGELPFKLEIGYVSVGKHEKIHLYYYFVESQRDPLNDPLILWNSGGPGCSGLSAMIFEYGPIRIDYKSFTGGLPPLTLNNETLTRVANMIFIDAPVGTGFSYADTNEDYYVKDDVDASNANYQFLQKWLLEHPRFLNNSLYIGGGSYAGKIVPILVQQIHQGIQENHTPKINLQGYILGNPETDEYMEKSMKIPFAHRLGLISDELYESARINCGEDYPYPALKSALCLKIQQDIDKCLELIHDEHVLEPSCGFVDFKIRNTLTDIDKDIYVTIDDIVQVFQGKKQWCRNYNFALSQIWANYPGVQEALFVRKGTIPSWERCNMTIFQGYYPTEVVTNVVDYHRSFFNTGYRALIYSGDHDMLVPHISSSKWIASLNLTLSDPWRPWFLDDQVAGYTRTFNNEDTYELVFATIKGAGHTASDTDTKPCAALLSRWLDHSKI